MADDEQVVSEELDTTDAPEGNDLDSSGEQPDETPQAPRLYAGKYKTPDEMEHAYQEAERTMHAKTTVTAKMSAQLKEWGCTVDEDTGAIIPPQQQTQTTEQAPPANVDNDPRTQFIDRFYEDPFAALAEHSMAVRGIEKRAVANTKREVAKLKAEPLYSKVADQLDAELAEIPDNLLANPQQAEQIVKDRWEKMVGRYALSNAKTAASDPVIRTEMIRSMGLDGPAEPESTGDRITITDSEKLMLRGLDITDPKEQAALIKKVRKAEKEERDNA